VSAACGYVHDLTPSPAPVLKACHVQQGMPLKAPTRKAKRAVLRGAGKDLGKNKIDCHLLLQKHEAARQRIAECAQALASAPGTREANGQPGVSLVPSPRALVRQLERSFALEFPLLRHRAHFVLDPE